MDAMDVAGDVHAAPNDRVPRSVQLTPRQYEVCLRVSRGWTNADIGRDLGLSVATVKVYRREAMERLGVDSSAQLVRRFLGCDTQLNAPQTVVRLPRVWVVDADVANGGTLHQGLRRTGAMSQHLSSLEALFTAHRVLASDVVVLVRGGRVLAELLHDVRSVRATCGCGVVVRMPAYRMHDWTAVREAGADVVMEQGVSLRELYVAIQNLRDRLPDD